MPERPCANYLAHRLELEGIDEILQRSGLDDFILSEALEERRRQAENDDAFRKGLGPFINHARSAFRIAILRAHKGCAPSRALDITLGDRPSEQWFCFLEDFDQIKAPGKSSVDRAKKILSQEILDKHFARRMGSHARTHLDLLVKHRARGTTLSVGQAGEIIGRIDRILDLLPQAIKQAHERIIGERRVPNEKEILSILKQVRR